MNVLVYSGSGTSESSVEQMRTTLRSFLSTSHDVMLASAKMLRDEPWPASTALLVIPGGRDVPFCRDLNGIANRRIRSWVESGGRFLGVCAGGYYASKKVDFEGGTDIEVVGDRELAFFPGTCRGTAFPGFVYDSEEGARETKLSIERTAWRDHWTPAPESIQIYYNGGGIFERADDMASAGVTVLARYADLPDNPVAAVRCRVGQGSAILWGVHPEHVSKISPSDVRSAIAMQGFREREKDRKSLFRSMLDMLGLEVPTEPVDPPAVKPQLLCADDEAALEPLVRRLHDIFDAEELLHDANDDFRLRPLSGLEDQLATETQKLSLDAGPIPDALKSGDEETRTPRDIVYCDSLPPSSLTPIFNVRTYFETWRSARPSQERPGALGSVLLYGEVVTSTQTLLDKNPKLLSALPSGLVSVASHQVSGRGRGGNSWISPPGCLQFSLVLRVPAKMSSRVVFVQYLFGLAVVEAVRNKKGYEELGLGLKWPNDIYAETGVSRTGSGGNGLEGFKKIGGILVNSSYSGGDFTLVVGCGINTTVPKPTTSLNELISVHNRRTGSDLPLFQPEELLALILRQFDLMWTTFGERGFEPFMDLYLDRWLHSDRLVRLEQTDETVRIVGITPDHGLLRTVKVHLDSRGNEVFGGPQGGYVDLQPDSNSFDMLAGLVKVKR